MADTICILMGIADIIAGALIFIGFGSHIVGIIFAVLMVLKGGMSFAG